VAGFLDDADAGVVRAAANRFRIIGDRRAVELLVHPTSPQLRTKGIAMRRLLTHALRTLPLALTVVGCTTRQPALAPRLTLTPALTPAAPSQVGMDARLNQTIDSIVQRALAEGAAPGAALAIGRHGRLVHQRAYGRIAAAADAAPVTDSTRYDMASLTKVVATTTAAMILQERGLLDIDRPVRDYLPELAAPEKAGITVRQLLAHNGGFRSGAPLWREFRGTAAFLKAMNERPLAYPPGDSTIYSDWDLIMTGVIVERLSGRPLAVFLQENVWGPLGMRDTGFNPLALGPMPADSDCTSAWRDDHPLLAQIAVQELDTVYRRRMIHGLVHDENACALGGVAGHAGLFSSARDLAVFAQLLLNGGEYNGTRILQPATIARWTARQGRSSRALGWDTPSPGSSAGRYFSPRSFGHTGFTGTSLWLDPERGVLVVLLTNRVHPTRANLRHEPLRRALADQVQQAIVDAPLKEWNPLPPPGGNSAVKVGADRLLTEFADLVNFKRVAVVANHSARLANGRHLVDALHAMPNVKLQALFGMEYDIRSNDYSLTPDGERAIDAQTGVVKYNLYGENHKPTPEMLEGVETVVFDIQEVGARFYEHINILGFVMEAAAEQGIDVVVLDRPNPITGLKQDGFVTDEEFRYRFGSYARVPVIHGLTMAELARFYNGEQALRGGVTARLHVVPMTGWRRALWFDQTGLPWRKPSPNLLTLQSLLAYTGTCLFEALNVSEGRGTDRPFELIGAPWLDHARAAERLNGLDLRGVRFDTISFMPEQKPFHGRPPELAGQLVKGISVRVTDRDAFEPFKTGVALVWAIHQLHPEKLVWNDSVLERLTATRRLKAMIIGGRTPAEIFASWQDELAGFAARSAPYRIYP
jgi:uncharacterized protein YbbC (DUF1343 family)